MLLRIVMRHGRRADAGQYRMAMEDAVMAVFGKSISSDARARRGHMRMTMQPTAMRGLRLCGDHKDARQGKSAGESEGGNAFASDII
jgi:hypothetical protein